MHSSSTATPAGGGLPALGLIAMLDDWFRTLRIPMPMATWRKLPRSAAYKYEYINGYALISPRPACCNATLDFASFLKSPHLQSPDIRTRTMEESEWDALPPLMSMAFWRVTPFESLTDKRRLVAAKDCLLHTRSGGDGPLIPGACVIATQTDQQQPVGAALVTLRKPASGQDAPIPLLTWIFVHPWIFRRGIGQTLLAAVVQRLAAMGHHRMESCILLANPQSLAWHWAMGFSLMRDRLGLASLRRNQR